MTASDSPGMSWRRLVSRYCAVGVVILGAAIAVDWLATGDAVRFWPGRPTMTPNTAIAVVLLGVGYLFHSMPSRTPILIVVRTLSGLVVAFATLAVAEYLMSIEFDIHKIANAVWAPESDNLVRTSPRTAIELILLAVSLAALTVSSPKAAKWSEATALLAFVTPLLALIGHIYSIEPLYGISPQIGMSISTLVASFALVACSLCASSNSTVMDLLLSPRPGGKVLRTLLPATFGAPLLLGWLQLLGGARGLFATDAGVSMFVLANIVLFTILIWVTARRLEREYALREYAENQFRAASESAADAILTVDDFGRVHYVNPSAERLFVISASDSVNLKFESLVRAVDLADRGDAVHGQLSRLRNGTQEAIGVRSTGATFPVELSMGRWGSVAGNFRTVVIRDTSERKHAEEALRARTSQLETMNRELQAFAYSASHDLRAPIRTIGGYATALYEDFGQSLPVKATRYVKQILSAVRSVGYLIDGLLNLSRLSTHTPQIESVNLSDVARSVVAELRSAEPTRSVGVHIADTSVVEADPGMMRSLLQNLLSNAWKFTGSSDHPKIEFGAVQGTVPTTYFVKDNGIGFDSSQEDLLFEPFRRLHTEQEFEGSGIGLATAKRIVERHGGEIWAHCMPGDSTCFFFRLHALRGLNSPQAIAHASS